MEKPSRSLPRATEAAAAASAKIETYRAVRVMAVSPAGRDTGPGPGFPETSRASPFQGVASLAQVTSKLPRRLGRKAVFQDLFHARAEDVDVVGCRVDAGCDPQPVELGMDDRRRHDSMLVPEIRLQLLGVDALDVHEADRTGIRVVQRLQD